MIRYLLQDWAANPRDPKARLVLAWFRLAHWASRDRDGLKVIVAVPIGVSYRLVVAWILGIEIPWHTKIGPRLTLHHGVGTVINDGTIIGSDVTLRHGVTLGNFGAGGPCPTINDHVEFGTGSTVLGDVNVGSNAKIGAGAVVLQDVPPEALAVGVPARIITQDQAPPSGV